MPLPTFLDGNTPTQLRGLAFLALSDTGYVIGGSVTDDGGGGGTSTWGTLGSSVPCRVDPMGGGEGVVANQLDDRSTHLITVPPNASVDHTDRFQVIDVGTFEITAVQTRTRETVRTLEAVELSHL